MKPERELVEIAGPDGKSLVGVLWLPPPEVRRRKVLIVMSHGGLSHKIGANRVQYHLARYFTQRGCPVFRFDPAGMGDSDGLVEAQPRQDFFGSIESGLFRESYRHAFRHLASRFSDHRWVVSGVCGGAISSLLAGVASEQPIAGFALISCPVILDGLRFDYRRREPPATALKYLRLLSAKLASPKAIWRFVTLQSDYQRMWVNARSVLLRAKDKLVARVGGSGPAAAPADASAPAAESAKPAVGLSPFFVEAAKEANRKAKVIFIYGDNDGFLWEFTDLFAAAYLTEAQRKKILRVVPHANHMFIWPEWQRQAFEIIDDWLAKEVEPS